VVLGLNTGQQRSFLTNWFTARGYKQAEAETKAEALLTHLARPALARLAEVPLLLSMLAFLAEAESELPNTRAELYMHAVGLLLGWRGKQITVDPVVAAAKEVQVYQAVARLAAHMLVTKEHGVISEVDALGFVATDLWMQLKQEAGLMVLRGREDQAPSFSPSKSVTANLYGFPHRSFEEYFAGHHLIANLEQSRVLIREHLHQAIWREPILFAFGYLSIQNPELGAELVEQVLLTQHSSDKMLPALPSDEYEELFHMDLLIALLVCNELRPSDKSTALIRKAARQALDIHLARVVEVQGGFDPLSSDITSTFARVSAGSVGNELRNLLLDHLFSKDSGLVRAEVVDLLVRMGSANESVVSVLLSKLDKELDQHVLRHLIEGLGRLSSGKDELVKELVARLQSKDSKWAKFRFDLIKALSQVTSAKTIVVEALLPVLEGNQDKHIQQMAIAALGQVAEGNEHVANILAARLQQRLDDFETTNATIKALGGLGVASTEVIKALISVVVDVDAESGPGAISIQLATNALTILATNNPEVFRTLETKVREELPNRTYLAIALCNVALTDEELQAQVLNMVEQEDDPEVQSHMIIAVSNVEAYGYAAVPLIAKVMATSNSNDVRQAAAVALMHLTRSGTDDTNLDVEVRPDAGETEQALVLTQPVKNKDAQDATRNYILQCMSKTAAPNVRQVAAYTLGVFDGDIKVVDTLATTLEQGALEQGEEEVIRVRVAAAVSLGKIGRGNMTAVNALCVGLNDVDGFVRDASATALERTGWLEDELTQSRLIALLSDPEGHVRLAALLALHRYGIPVPNFRTALIRGFGDKHFVVKEKSIALAAQLARTDQEMVDVLSGLLFSPSAEDYQKLAALQALAEAEKIEVDWLLRILKGEGDFSMRQEAANILIELDRSPTSVEQGTAKVDVAKELKELLMSMDQQARSNWPLRDKYKMVYRTLYYIVINQANVKNTG